MLDNSILYAVLFISIYIFRVRDNVYIYLNIISIKDIGAIITRKTVRKLMLSTIKQTASLITDDAAAARRTQTAPSSATTHNSSRATYPGSVNRKKKRIWGRRRQRHSPCRAAPRTPIRKCTKESRCRCRFRVWRATGAPTASIRSQWRLLPC